MKNWEFNTIPKKQTRIKKWMKEFTCLQCVHIKKNPEYDFNDYWIWKGHTPGKRKTVRIYSLSIFNLHVFTDFHVEDPETYLCRFFELKTDEIGKKGKGIKICKLKDRDLIL